MKQKFEIHHPAVAMLLEAIQGWKRERAIKGPKRHPEQIIAAQIAALEEALAVLQAVKA